jgi:cytochrome P450
MMYSVLPQKQSAQMLSDAAPAKIESADRPLQGFKFIITLLKNPVKAVPRAIYRERLLRLRVLGRDTVWVMAPDLIHRVLVDEANNFEKTEIQRRAMEPICGDTIVTAIGSRWRWQRRAIAPFFRQEQIQGLVPAIIAAAERTRDRWLSHPLGTEIDIASEMTRTTFDIILSTFLPGRINNDHSPIQQSISCFDESTFWSGALAMLGAPRWAPFPGVLKARRAIGHLHRVLDSLIAEAKRNPGNRSDLLSLLISATDPETGKSMNDIDVRDNLLTFITVGHDSTALALTWTFYLLSIHPEIEQRVKSEIAAATGDGALSAEHIGSLAYTKQVIQEAVRLYPPGALIQRTAKRDLQLGNEEIRAGTTVYVPVYAVHRHEAYWRKPDEFDPNRFDPEPAKLRDRYTYLPFGAGSRSCIGQSFAQMEATAVLATLLNSFQLRVRPGYIPEPTLRVLLGPAGGMPMRIIDAAPRKQLLEPNDAAG